MYDQYTNETKLQGILHYTKQYHIFCCGDESPETEINSALDSRRRLNQTTVYLFLFHIFENNEADVITKTELTKNLNLLLHYSVRHLICEVGSNSLRGLCKTLYSCIFSRKENKPHYRG